MLQLTTTNYNNREKRNEAESGTWNTPFTDVADWAKPYVGYAYTNGLAGGTSATTFSGNDTVSASQYLTFVLRALGYESGTDFQWNKAWELSDKIGLTDGRYNASTTNFTRGDVAIVSNYALSTPLKGQSRTLADSLGLNGVVVENNPKTEEIAPSTPATTPPVLLQTSHLLLKQIMVLRILRVSIGSELIFQQDNIV